MQRFCIGLGAFAACLPNADLEISVEALTIVNICCNLETVDKNPDVQACVLPDFLAAKKQLALVAPWIV